MRVAAAVALLVTVAACGSTSPSAMNTEPLEPSVAASWIADDGSVVALNVVLPAGIRGEGLDRLAERYRNEHARARVILRFFSALAGPERRVIGHVPTDGAPLPPTQASAGVVATFDFPAEPSRPIDAAP